jgi:xanthine dehydrogenase/oxidase
MAYKQAKRRDDDIAIVNAGLRLIFDEEKVDPNNPNSLIIKDACFASGGMGPTSLWYRTIKCHHILMLA